MILPTFTLPQLAIVLGLILIMSELFLGIQTGFDLVLIGSAIVIGGIAGSLTNSIIVTLIVSTLLSLLYIFYGRSFIKHKIIVTTQNTNIDKLIGQIGFVSQTIHPDKPGMVKLSDEEWRATSKHLIKKGEKVVVEAVEGVTVFVNKLTK